MDSNKPTSFELVSNMNTAFGNPKGDPGNIDWDRVRNQCKNIGDEYLELLFALGADAAILDRISALNKNVIFHEIAVIDVEEVRDALCDIQVFSQGAQHFMGVDGDADMEAVVAGVMTRFIKDQADLDATLAIFRSKGLTDFYIEGSFPTMILKSGSNQPDAPKGKFLKSASYQPTVFPPL